MTTDDESPPRIPEYSLAMYIKPAGETGSPAKEIADKISKAMEGTSSGRWCQFHPSYAPEAEGAPFSDWDSSHDVSAVKDGKRKRIATFKHADDAAYADLVQPDNMRILLSALADAERERHQANERCAAAIEDYNVQLAGHRLSAKQSTENLLRAKAAEVKLAEAVKVMERQDAALKPFADAVFNDNGDMTITIPSLTSAHCAAAYFAARDAARFIASMKGDGK